jgi:excinuclease ABC subunit A
LDKGHTVIVVEHNIDLIKCADHIIDLGKDGGEKGGKLMIQGTPEEVAENKNSYTATYLSEKL